MTSRNCDMVVTYRKNCANCRGDEAKFMIELGGRVTSSVAYVALGLSEDTKMPEASAMACIRCHCSPQQFQTYAPDIIGSRLQQKSYVPLGTLVVTKKE